MGRDIRATELYKEAELLFRTMRQPGTGQISEAAEVSVSPDGKYAVFAGTILEALETGPPVPPTRVCRTDLTTGETHVLTFGPNTDRLPKYSPDGKPIAFLSDRGKAGDFQLYLLDPRTSAVKQAARIDGWVEYLQWSPDGKRILLGVAGHGADVAGGQGAVASKQAAEQLPSWIPTIETGDEEFRWRRIWVYELATDEVRLVSKININVWEANWCGNDRLVAVVSPGPGEGLWYSARLHILKLDSRNSGEIYAPRDQLGWPAASPSGKHLAVIEAVCSDRWLVAGDLLLIDTRSGEIRRVDTHGIDVSHAEWRSERKLMLAGHRGFDSVVGVLDAAYGVFTETWTSREISGPGFYIQIAGLGEADDCVLSGRGFTRSPEIGVIRGGKYRTVRSFDVGYGEAVKVIDAVETVAWQAPDGLEIQGWLLKPGARDGALSKAPFPLILYVHGGPVWQVHPMCLTPVLLMLLRRGYALFLTNPRGSTGRGQDFVRRVIGDIGGAETTDHLSGIDHLVKVGIADAKRLGVTGASHGGFMSSWIIGQDSRFAAAVPVAPVTNWVSEHLISNLPHYCSMVLGDHYANPTGKYFSRSPIMYAHQVKTPTLNICGALDRCTPSAEAMQFHSALLENGVKSMLVTYPEEGHGIRKFPAAIDYAARVVGWFEEHLKAS
jgi:dipeptidyl aminopeptidase/acylaminoacyl peptidase